MENIERHWELKHKAWYMSRRGISFLGQIKKYIYIFSSIKDTAALYVFSPFFAPPSWLVLHNICTPLKHRVIQSDSSLEYISVKSNHYDLCKIFLFLYFMEKSLICVWFVKGYWWFLDNLLWL